MSRADSTSPPPYSYENSSFAPPPPGAGQVSRSWDFQMRFESAHEDVRWAILQTITAWEISGTGQPWYHIPRSSIQNAYDSAPQDLRIALDYIVQHNLTCYFNDDTDRRRHLYFSRRDAGWPPVGGLRVLLTADQFVQEFILAKHSQNAVLTTIASWERKRTGVYQEPHLNSLHGWYKNALNEQKIILNWILEIGAGAAVTRLQVIPSREEQIRTSSDKRQLERQKARSLIKLFSP